MTTDDAPRSALDAGEMIQALIDAAAAHAVYQTKAALGEPSKPNRPDDWWSRQEAERAALERYIGRLEEALRFYADPASYRYAHVAGPWAASERAILADAGERARSALGTEGTDGGE